MSNPLDLEAASKRDSLRADMQQQRVLAAKQDLSWVMSDSRGRRFIWGQLENAGIYRTSMAGTSELTAFNEGRRDQGLRLLALLLENTPAEYLLMQRENTLADP